MPRITKQQMIDELQAKLDEAYKLLAEEQKKNAELIENANDTFANSADRQQMQKQIKKYQDIAKLSQQNYDSLRKKYDDLKDKYIILCEADQKRKKAGRKPHDDAWQKQYQKFIEMYNAGLSQKDIMQQLNISRATYFRLKKLVTIEDKFIKN